MKMKRYIAAGTHQALEQVHEELGDDALILSTRSVPEGVEVIAAVDYEDDLLATAPAVSDATPMANPLPKPRVDGASIEASGRLPEVLNAGDAGLSLQGVNDEIRSLRSILEAPLSRLAWAEAGRQSPLRAGLVSRLTGLGLHPVVANRIADQTPGFEDAEHGWQQALSILEHSLPSAADELMSTGGVAALVGPTGVGKTTTVAKIAARFALQHGRRQVALVTMDHYRIGAHEQLRTYGKLLGVPVYSAGDEEELRVILNQMSDRKLVLVDTAGTSQRDLHLSEQFSMLDVDGIDIKRYLVISATGNTALNDEVLDMFGPVRPQRCILTKVDEATSLGGVLSVLIKHGLPAVYMGDGQRVPDDFHELTAGHIVKTAVELAACSRPAQSDEAWMHALGVMEEASHAHAGI